MATITHLVDLGELEMFPIPDDVDRLPVRPLWMSRELCEYVDSVLFYKEEKLGSRTAYEHLEQFFIDFRCNAVVHGSDLRRIMPTKKGTWKLHPPMLRVYGWVPRQHSFVAVCCELEAATKKDRSLNDRCRDKVLEFVRRHGINEVVYGDFPYAFPKTP